MICHAMCYVNTYQLETNLSDKYSFMGMESAVVWYETGSNIPSSDQGPPTEMYSIQHF